MRNIFILYFSLFGSTFLFGQPKKDNPFSEIMIAESRQKFLVVFNDTLYDFIPNNEIPDFKFEKIDFAVKPSFISVVNNLQGKDLFCGKYSKLLIIYTQSVKKKEEENQ